MIQTQVLAALVLASFFLSNPFDGVAKSSSYSLIANAYAKASTAENEDGSDAADNGEEAGSEVEFEECQKNKERYEFLNSYTVECTKSYLLYESNAKVSKKSHKAIQIGTFNIMRIAQSQSRFKRYDMVAQIINQWDITAVVEIMSTPSREISQNNEVDKVLAQFNDNEKKYSAKKRAEYRELLEGSYMMSRYLVLLKELQKLDESWSLIMAPQGTGEGGAPEYSAFYYRSSVIENIPADYCKGKRGCLAHEKDEDIVSRLPFAAKFKANNSEFLAIALHLRFRPACQSENSEQCKVYKTKGKEIISQLDGINQADQNRFVELYELSDSLKKSKEEVLIMGDFNLEHTERNKEAWKAALLDNEDLVVLNDENTSISAKNGLEGGSNYDHFILNPKKSILKDCDVDSVKPFNFVLDPENPKTSIPELKELRDFLMVRNADPKSAVALFEETFSARQNIVSCDESGCESEKYYSSVEVKQEVADFKKRVIDTKRGNYAVFHELISDHIPISITCNF